jgi:GT2 family glycosyltransferase
MRLAIVILNWNGAADTLACLDSVERARVEGVEAVVVDNGSAEDDVARVAAAVAARPWAEIVRNAENLGFTGGCNVGIARALERGADYVMVLNNDATVEPGALEALVAHLEAHPRTGLVSPLILDASGERIWAAGGVRASREVVCALGLTGRPATEAPREPFEAYALIGCALVARREVLERVGAFDDAYFAYVEDVDLSRRARAAGWALEVIPSARVRHRVSAASGGGYTPLRSYLLGRGTAIFVRRRADLGQRVGFALAAPAGLVAAAVREALSGGNPAAVVAKMRGYLDGLRGRPVDRRYFTAAR